jgi:hypothetical protein
MRARVTCIDATRKSEIFILHESRKPGCAGEICTG